MIITNETEVLQTPSTSSGDKKKYKLIKLPNGLRTLLVQSATIHAENDFETKIKDRSSAVALCIDVGSFEDPFEVQGLCHFLEHMVNKLFALIFSNVSFE